MPSTCNMSLSSKRFADLLKNVILTGFDNVLHKFDYVLLNVNQLFALVLNLLWFVKAKENNKDYVKLQNLQDYHCDNSFKFVLTFFVCFCMLNEFGIGDRKHFERKANRLNKNIVKTRIFSKIVKFQFYAEVFIRFELNV